MKLLVNLLTIIQLTLAYTYNYEDNSYIIIELDTSQSLKPLYDFKSANPEFSFHHQSPIDNHYVFSIPKNHSTVAWLGNYNSNSHSLIKRTPESLQLISQLKSIHLLEEKLIEKRLPVPMYENELDDTYKVSKDDLSPRLEIVDSSQQPLKEAADHLSINDPIFIQQWHLINTNYPGNDVNVTGLWYEGITGKGITVAVVDDGLDANSPDLADNFNKQGSWDFNDNTNLPLPRLSDDHHGTRCAGEIAAVKNDVCGIGVAYDSKVAGIRILSGRINAEIEAASLIFGLDVNDIYSCSWGPTDDGKTLSEPDKIVKKAIIKGVQQGRQNKGSIYVFASGNGGRYQDSCNFDGYTNSIYSITVGAIDHQGLHPTYAEACSAVMVVTYSSGSKEHIHTTNINNSCSHTHGGTSAAAPLAAGIFTLVLQMNPNLTWRDLQYVAMFSSVPVNDHDGDYQVNGLGRKYSHKYGYGKIDAYGMAHFGKTWKNVKPQSWYYSDVIKIQETIDIGKESKSLPIGNGLNLRDESKDVQQSDEDKKLVSQKLLIDKSDLELMNLERVEHVTVVVNIMATYRGGVGVRLISPAGVVSNLCTFRRGDRSGRGFYNWTFMSVAHWGESGVGEWKLEVFGDENISNTIILQDWQLRFFGESIDAEKAETFDLDKDYAAVRRERLSENPEHDKQPEVNTSDIAETETKEDIKTNEGETKTNEGETKTTENPENPETTSPEPTSTSGSEEDEEGVIKQSTGDHTGQYFMAIAVMGFIIVVVYMKYHKGPGGGRRKRRRDDYEFDIIPGEDYSDSEEEGEEREDDRLIFDERAEEDQRKLYEEMNAESVTEDSSEMFKIGEDEDEIKKNEVKDKESI